ncbi:MAG: type II toxin-antitoxin system VapC family toxin [Bacteroidaceae bacterium]|nr:type II toxin-antitoxin system VapC family toxin [Bacteroidaceae bacterium]
MNIFCDTNIIMEFLQQRKFVTEVGQILAYAIQQEDDLFISSGSFYTITYLTERYLKSDQTLTKEERLRKLRYILNGVLGTFKLCNQMDDIFSEGVNDILFDDLEDSYQAHVAEKTGCEVLLTVNDRHFAHFAEHSMIKVMTPQTFISTYIQD